jgi:hypothetical protein
MSESRGMKQTRFEINLTRECQFVVHEYVDGRLTQAWGPYDRLQEAKFAVIRLQRMICR